MRKVRPDSKLGNLPKEQRDQLVDWLLGEGIPLRESQAARAGPLRRLDHDLRALQILRPVL